MSTATMQQTPAIPPRPSRSQEKDNGSSVPSIPPRPGKRFNRSASPNPDRFAPSPLNESPFQPKSPQSRRFSAGLNTEPVERTSSVDLPSIGQEGQEYAAVADEFSSSPEQERGAYVAPEQTRTIGEDIKLYAPKPTVPAQSAKQRVAAVTRTDSDKAAAFGIGRPSSEDPYPRSLKKKASTTSQLSHDSHIDDEQGIPEIGQRVPLIGNAGDVQAPSPAPGSSGNNDGVRPSKYHVRRTSGRSTFGSLPPDSYGLHGHGVESTDKLQRAYYEKHPEAKKLELHNHAVHDRVKEYHMSSDELNKIVRDTASRGAGFGTTEYVGTPSEQVGFQATEEYTSRMSSPRPASAASKPHESVASPLKESTSRPGISLTGPDAEEDDDDEDVIHVDEPGSRNGFVKFGDEPSAVGEGTEDGYEAPILAPDEVAKDPSHYEMQPAVEPPPERRGSTFEMEQPRSRPSSRPGSIYTPPPPEMHSTALDDVEEYEPLFPEDGKGGKKAITAQKLKDIRQRFPSRDIWEDAPNSVHATAEVSTPEPNERLRNPQEQVLDIPTREGETPAQAFARRQEELAETEDRNPDSFLKNKPRPRSWVESQPHLAKEIHSSPRPGVPNRFPSRDIWEDTPDSLQLQTTVSTPQSEKDPQSAAAEQSPVERPAIPTRPRKQGSGDDKPAVPDRPKPQVPARPSKPASESKGPEPAPKQKPAVPARPVGGKIAALQAGFMSDLNKRLQIGPQAPKKEEPKAEDLTEEKEKAPLVDARKGRARGPQRRAPTKSPSPSGAAPASNGKPTLSFSTTRTLWCIDEEGTMTVDQEEEPSEMHSNPTEGDSKLTTGTSKSEEPPKSQRSEIGNPTESSSKPSEPSSTPTGSKPSESTSSGNTTEQTKTLATNTAGESILEETIEKKPESDEVEEVGDAKDDVVS
ncbi:altered inheritance of mitochondria protein 21 [Xylariales sp. AK1849]|nr:altered inheritance of mitochondria protein 21 [Xylariales sp. AK1849]